jgi:Mce-associated membrane protein
MSRRRRVGAAAAVVVVIILAVGDVLLMKEVSDGRHESAARHDALQAAQRLVPELLSYDPESLSADLARARNTTTGKFRHDFDTLVDDVVRPAAAHRHVSTRAVVSGAGVMSSTGSERVTILVLVTQTSTSSVEKSPVVSTSRVKVLMVRYSGRWLIAGLDPV